MKRSMQEIVELLVFALIALLVGTGVVWLVGWVLGLAGTVLTLLAGLVWSLLRFLVPIAIVAAAVYALVRLMNRGDRHEPPGRGDMAGTTDRPVTPAQPPPNTPGTTPAPGAATTPGPATPGTTPGTASTASGTPGGAPAPTPGTPGTPGFGTPTGTSSAATGAPAGSGDATGTPRPHAASTPETTAPHTQESDPAEPVTQPHDDVAAPDGGAGDGHPPAPETPVDDDRRVDGPDGGAWSGDPSPRGDDAEDRRR